MSQIPPPDPIDTWILFKSSQHNARSTTGSRYRRVLERLRDWLAAQDPPVALLQVTADDLERYAGPELHKQGQSPKSRRVAVAAIRGFYKWAARRGLCTGNPARYLDPPRGGLRLPTVASQSTAEALLMAPDLDTFIGVRDAAILTLLVGLGLRVSEVVGLNVGHLMWGRDTDGKEQLTLLIRGKGSRERIMPASSEARVMLRAYLGHQELETMDLQLDDGDRPLFVSTRRQDIPPHEYRGEARRLQIQAVQRMVMKYGRAAGLEDKELHPHALRHLFGTHLVNQDVDIRVIQALMGHADINTTQIYTHLAAKKLSDIMTKAGPLRHLRSPARDLARHLDGQR